MKTNETIKQMNFNEFEAVIYPNAVGKYEIHIKVKGISNQSWNYKRLVKEYPSQVEALKEYGFTNKSRDLYAKGLGIKHAVKTKEQAEAILNVYNLILSK
jgi:hypothetical protein